MDRDFENRRIRDFIRIVHESNSAPELSDTWRNRVMDHVRRTENSQDSFRAWDFMAPKIIMASLALTLFILAAGLPAISSLSDDLLRAQAGNSYAAYSTGWLENQ